MFGTSLSRLQQFVIILFTEQETAFLVTNFGIAFRLESPNVVRIQWNFFILSGTSSGSELHQENLKIDEIVSTLTCSIRSYQLEIVDRRRSSKGTLFKLDRVFKKRLTSDVVIFWLCWYFIQPESQVKIQLTTITCENYKESILHYLIKRNQPFFCAVLRLKNPRKSGAAVHWDFAIRYWRGIWTAVSSRFILKRLTFTEWLEKVKSRF